jgi:hypothetical protein
MPYPAKKTPELVETVLVRIACGETLTALGKELDFHPTAWGNWVAADEGLALAYRRAREVGGDAIAEQALALVDEQPARVEGRVDTGHVAWRRLQAEMRLKLLAKWYPSRYGDKVGVEHTGPDGGPVQVAHANVAELAQQMRQLAKQPPKAIEDGRDVL